MYCIKCGVELGNSEKKCPLCLTPVYYPELSISDDTPYPKVNVKDKVSPRGIYFIASFVFLISAIISVVCDMNIDGRFSWSGIVVGALLLSYVVVILPGWFSRPHPAVFAPVDFAAASLFLWYLDYISKGGWFWSFALPLTGMVALIVCSATILCYYVRHGYLYIFGGAFILFGFASLPIEWLANITFGLPMKIVWGFYPTIALSLIGIMLIVIAIVRPFRESLCRIFSI